MQQVVDKSGKFKLCLFSSSFYEEQRAEIIRLQKVLNENGWRVSFLLESYGENIDYITEPKVMRQLIAKRIASGDTTADGFIVRAGMAAELVGEGLAQDAGSALRQATPSLYERFRGLFEKSTAGIPVYLSCRPYGDPLALVLKEECASRLKTKMNSIDDLLTLADIMDGKKLYINPQTMYDIWAYQQGYYSLAHYRVNGMLYAAYTDEKCMPVPLESIPGFQDFLKKYFRLYTSVGYDSNTDQARLAGGIYLLNMYPLFYTEVPQQYMAYPLGYAPPVLPDDAPWAGEEIAVSTTSAKAADIARCIEWLFASQDNYDAVRYGKEGKDFRITGDRLEMLSNGNPVTVDSGLYNRYFSCFYFDSMERISVQAPVNYEEAAASCRHRPEPMDVIGTEGIKAQSKYSDAMLAFNEGKSESITKRYEVLWDVYNQEPFHSFKTEDDFVTAMRKNLDNVHEDTEALVDGYYRLIQQALQTREE